MAYSTYEYVVRNIEKIPEYAKLKEVKLYKDNILKIVEKLVRYKKEEPKIYICENTREFFVKFSNNVIHIKVLKEDYGENKVLISLKDNFFYSDLDLIGI